MFSSKIPSQLLYCKKAQGAYNIFMKMSFGPSIYWDKNDPINNFSGECLKTKHSHIMIILKKDIFKGSPSQTEV